MGDLLQQVRPEGKGFPDKHNNKPDKHHYAGTYYRLLGDGNDDN